MVYGHLLIECEAAKSICAFNGEKNVLSNFYGHTLQDEGKSFKNSEQIYQWRKAVCHGMDDTAIKILEAEKPWDAKRLGEKIKSSPQWEESKVNVMRMALQVKLENCAEFKTKLLDSGTKILVECTQNRFWGSGLTREETLKTSPSDWPGRNMMGELLTEIRVNISIPSTSAYTSVKNITKYVHENAPSKPSIQPSGQASNTEATGTMGLVKEDNGAVQLVLDLLDEATGPKSILSPEQMSKVKSFLEQKDKDITISAASPGLKRKVISPPAEPQPAKKAPKPSRPAGGIPKFFSRGSKKT